MKKGEVSPLIATVLLIGFTIALAGLVMIWGQTFFGEIDTLETTTTLEPTTTTIEESTTTTLELNETIEDINETGNITT